MQELKSNKNIAIKKDYSQQRKCRPKSRYVTPLAIQCDKPQFSRNMIIKKGGVGHSQSYTSPHLNSDGIDGWQRAVEVVWLLRDALSALRLKKMQFKMRLFKNKFIHAQMYISRQTIDCFFRGEQALCNSSSTSTIII